MIELFIASFVFISYTCVYYSAPDGGLEYCDERVCLCVCVMSAVISSELHVRSSPNICACCLWPWLGAPLVA